MGYFFHNLVYTFQQIRIFYERESRHQVFLQSGKELGTQKHTNAIFNYINWNI